MAGSCPAEIVFDEFPKIPRLYRDVVITEKIDGTNAQVIISKGGYVAAASRTRLIWPGKTTDNYGFAAWVADNNEMLRRLGPGRHFGEWWGAGIQRGYGLTEKRFSLFRPREDLPPCVRVVPVLYEGAFSESRIQTLLEDLRKNGSVAVPGFMQPEGIVIFHKASGQLFKVTLENDGKPKGEIANA